MEQNQPFVPPTNEEFTSSEEDIDQVSIILSILKFKFLLSYVNL